MGFLKLWRAEQLPSSGVQASHCVGFSRCRAQALGARASAVSARRLSICGPRAPEHRLRSCGDGLSGSVYVESSHTWGGTRVTYARRWILILWATRGVQKKFFVLFLQNCFCESDVILRLKKISLAFKKSKLFIIALKSGNNPDVHQQTNRWIKFGASTQWNILW